MILACRCIQDVAAVELPAGKQVQGCGEQAYPGGASDWMEQQVAGWHTRPQQSNQYPHGEGIAKHNARMQLREWNNSGICDGDGQRWNGKEKSNHWPG